MNFISDCLLYPGILFGTGFFLNFFIWGVHSSGAVSTDLKLITTINNNATNRSHLLQ